MKINLSTMSETERSTHFDSLDNEALTASIEEMKAEARPLFANESPTVKEAETAVALNASIQFAVTEDNRRKALVQKAAEEFAAARQSFAVNDGVESGDEGDEGDEGDDPEGEGDESGDDEGDESGESEGGESVEAAKAPAFLKKDEEEDKKKVTTAAAAHGSSRLPARTSAARKVGAKTKRPERKATSPVTITAAADVPGYATSSVLDSMTDLAKAAQARVKGFPRHNEASAVEAFKQSAGEPVLHKFGVADLGLNFPDSLVASGKNGNGDYEVMRDAIKDHQDGLKASMSKGTGGDNGSLTAAGWCAPSEPVYTWLADYVVDGLLTAPEVSAPRGGLLTTTGPALAQTTFADLANFGFTQTETQAIAATVKPCEVIECPPFVDHRLDVIGYCWKIPILTEKAFPELVADALRLSTVLFAHKKNARHIADIVAGSTAITVTGLGATFTDTLEAVAQVAVKERRWWNLGENAIIEVKMPVFVKEVFRADISRRQAIAVDAVTDAYIMGEFAVRNIAIEFITDYQDLAGGTVTTAWPSTFQMLMYPAGTWSFANDGVISLQGVYDAASLSVNEYTGVFLEESIMTLKNGYRSHKITVPICTAGLSGGDTLDCNTATPNNAVPVPAA